MPEDKTRQNQGEIVIYQAEDGLTKVECRFVDETVWLTQQQMAHNRFRCLTNEKYIENVQKRCTKIF